MQKPANTAHLFLVRKPKSKARLKSLIALLRNPAWRASSRDMSVKISGGGGDGRGKQGWRVCVSARCVCVCVWCVSCVCQLPCHCDTHAHTRPAASRRQRTGDDRVCGLEATAQLLVQEEAGELGRARALQELNEDLARLAWCGVVCQCLRVCSGEHVGCGARQHATDTSQTHTLPPPHTHTRPQAAPVMPSAAALKLSLRTKCFWL